MSDEKRSSKLSMNDYFFEINFLLKLEVKLVSAILNIILTIFKKKENITSRGQSSPAIFWRL